MGEKKSEGSALAAEYEGSNLRDARLDRRFLKLARAVAGAPELSFPQILGAGAELEGAYRFFSNKDVDAHQMLAPHIRQTHKRMVEKGGVVLAVHDSTELQYRGERDALGPLSGGNGQGFVAHLCLAVGAREPRMPFGVLGFSSHAHPTRSARKGMSRGEVAELLHEMPRAQKHSARWERLALKVGTAVPEGVRLIHVMDQEADDYMVFAELHQAKQHFVIRGDNARKLQRNGTPILEVLKTEQAKVFREVPLSRRPLKSARGRHPVRAKRTAQLSIRWTSIELKKPRHPQTEVLQVPLNVVHVFEEKPPDGEEPIDWFLLTNERVENLEDAAAVVDYYRARWIIEEFNKALKSGCAIEKRQLTNLPALVRALALFLPMAWHMLLLRHLSRENNNPPASRLFTHQELRLLSALLQKRGSKAVFDVTDKTTVREAMLGIAAIGGHLPNNGEPGWIVLGRGYQTFIDACSVMSLVEKM